VGLHQLDRVNEYGSGVDEGGEGEAINRVLEGIGSEVVEEATGKWVSLQMTGSMSWGGIDFGWNGYLPLPGEV
jgi:hypothetical protein